MAITVLETTDRAEAQAAHAMLVSFGLEASLEGIVDAARLGVGDVALPLKVQVTEADAARARELLEAQADQAEAVEPPRSHKKPLIALGLAFIWPSAGHFYAGRPWTGAMLLVTWLAVLATMRWSNPALGYLALVLIDAVGSVRVVNTPVASTLKQMALGALGAVVIGLIAMGPGAFERWSRARLEGELSRLQVACGERLFEVENVGDAPRVIEVKSMRAARDRQTESVTVVEPTRVELPPGARHTFALVYPEGGACAPKTLLTLEVEWLGGCRHSVRLETGAPGEAGVEAEIGCTERSSRPRLVQDADAW